MFPGGASASAGDVPALHCLRVHAPHLGQVQQGLETERGLNPGPPALHSFEIFHLSACLSTPYWIVFIHFYCFKFSTFFL